MSFQSPFSPFSNGKRENSKFVWQLAGTDESGQS